MDCTFCDVPKVGPGKNASLAVMLNQIEHILYLHPEVKFTKRLNVHFARMGEPTFNPDVIHAGIRLATMDRERCRIHPVVSTMLPDNNTNLILFLSDWVTIKNKAFDGKAGLQLSINSTNQKQRFDMFGGHALPLKDIAPCIVGILHRQGLKGRKIALNFAINDNTIIDAEYLANLFPPKWFMCKITPMHVTESCKTNKDLTTDGYQRFYPYQQHENNLKAAGFDVLVFIPSLEEDLSRITCGNAILSGSKPECEYTIIE
jgi:23S rRNA (adenine2503-C2)-methyltransferase